MIPAEALLKGKICCLYYSKLDAVVNRNVSQFNILFTKVENLKLGMDSPQRRSQLLLNTQRLKKEGESGL